MSGPALIDLDAGSLDPRVMVGKVLGHRPTRDVGFPLFVGVTFALLGSGLLLAAVVIGLSAARGGLLIWLDLALGLGFAWFAVVMLRDAALCRRFNRRRYQVRFDLKHVEIHSVDGVERVALGDAPNHPFLRGLRVHHRVHSLVRARAACQHISPKCDVRLVIETLALTELECLEATLDGPERPLFALIVQPGEVRLFHDAEDLADARSSGLPLYSVDTDRDPGTRSFVPRLEPGAVRPLRG